MAFISGGISGVALATPSKTSKLSQVRFASHVSRRNSRTVVALRDNEGDPSITEERRREVIDKTRRVVNEKFGWTSFAEFLNGRLAMFFFAYALLVEGLAPSHPSLLTQVYHLLPFLPRISGY